jgi:hypothetical protein
MLSNEQDQSCSVAVNHTPDSTMNKWTMTSPTEDDLAARKQPRLRKTTLPIEDVTN